MLPEKIILDEPFIWNAGRLSDTVIELSKITNQQIFLISKDAKMLTAYFRHINEDEVRAIDFASNIYPYCKFGNLDLVFLSLN